MSLIETEQVTILQPTIQVKVKCECGSTIQQRSLRSHLKTKKHKNYLEKQLDIQEECTICMSEERIEKYKCKTCKNKHCMNCHKKINRCPYCRADFPVNKCLETFFWNALVRRLTWLCHCIDMNMVEYVPTFVSDWEFIRTNYSQVEHLFHRYPETKLDLNYVSHYISQFLASRQ